jgi:hypothetical protein
MQQAVHTKIQNFALRHAVRAATNVINNYQINDGVELKKIGVDNASMGS